MATKSGGFSWFTERVNEINMILQGRGYLVSSTQHSINSALGKAHKNDIVILCKMSELFIFRNSSLWLN